MFCILEKNKKTYSYLKKFIDYIKENKIDSLTFLDNLIQKDEIKFHLEINGFDLNNSNEKLNWINKYGKSFREYLNTIKVASLIWIASKQEKEFTWDEFEKLLYLLNNNKKCLDTIHT